MTTVVINGTDRSCDVLGGMRAQLGRRTVREPGRAATAALVVEADALAQPDASAVRVPVTITDAARARIAGTTTDATVTHDDEGAAEVALTVMGPLATAAAAMIGDEPWPAETVAARAARIAAAITVPVVVQGSAQQMVRGIDVDRRSALELLAGLAGDTGGWVFDACDPATGAPTIFVQPLDARRVTAATAIWDDEPPGEPWDAMADQTWIDDDEPSSIAPIALHCTGILWEPTWTQEADIANRIVVEYGPDPDNLLTTAAEDTDSVAQYGRHTATITTQLLGEADAQLLAAVVLERSARPRWALQQLRIPLDDSATPPAVIDQLLGALPGTRVTVTGMPPPAPSAGFLGVIEGWEQTWTTEDQRELVLFLSDARHSMAVPVWDAEPLEAIWDDAATDWESDL